MAPISVEGLTKRCGSVAAVNALSFMVGPGMVTGFWGPNGAGKTSPPLKVLLGLVAPNEGGALVCGRLYRDLERPLCTIGAVLDSGVLHPGRSGRGHLRVLAAAAQLPSAGSKRYWRWRAWSRRRPSECAATLSGCASGWP